MASDTEDLLEAGDRRREPCTTPSSRRVSIPSSRAMAAISGSAARATVISLIFSLILITE